MDHGLNEERSSDNPLPGGGGGGSYVREQSIRLSLPPQSTHSRRIRCRRPPAGSSSRLLHFCPLGGLGQSRVSAKSVSQSVSWSKKGAHPTPTGTPFLWNEENQTSSTLKPTLRKSDSQFKMEWQTEPKRREGGSERETGNLSNAQMTVGKLEPTIRPSNGAGWIAASTVCST